MTKVSVNEPSAHGTGASPPASPAQSAAAATSPRSRPRGRRWLRRIFVALLGAAAVVALAWFFVLPWLLRNRVQAALHAAGVTGITFHVAKATPWGSALTDVQAGSGDALGIDRIALDYTPLDLLHGRLHAVHVRGGRLELRVRNGQVDMSPLTAFVFGKNRPTTQPAAPGGGGGEIALPLDEIDLTDSVVSLQTEKRTVEIPVDVAVQNRSADQLLVAAHVGPDKNLRLNATVDLSASSGTFQGTAEPGWTLLTVRSIWPAAEVGVGGVLQFDGSAAWGGSAPSGEMTLRIVQPAGAAPADESAAPAAKLQLAGGVFHVTGQFADPPTLRLDVKDASLAMADQFATAGVTGTVALSDLSPPKTPPDQRLIASTLKIGALELAQGAVEFQVIDANTVHVERTHWLAFGGSVWAGDFAVDGEAPIKVTLHAQDIELKDLLHTFAQGKASGEGRISGELPVVINGSDVRFGDGRVVSLHGGQVQITDAETLTSVAAGAAAAAQSPSQKEQLQRNIVRALRDFQYDRLTAQLQSGPGGQLSARVRMTGHGRTGARQGLDYELSVHRLDLALKSYLSIKGAMDVPKAAATQAGGKALSP